MAKELIYKLSNPGYTIYHRAALGGLAATIQAWGGSNPEGIETELHDNYVRIVWGDELSDQEALRRILDKSFKLNEEKLIVLPGQGVRADQDTLLLAIHNGLYRTFLQHNKMRATEKGVRHIEIRSYDDEVGQQFTYKAVKSYSHQKAQGTDLLNEKLKGEWPDKAKIPQSVIPGITSGAYEIDASPDEAVVLMFLMVGCSIFLLRPRTSKDRAQYCVVVPDVINLRSYAFAILNIISSGPAFNRFNNNYLNRIVGGAEEAALRFLIDLKANDLQALNEPAIIGCLAIAMGRVAWDKNQINRSLIIKIRDDYWEIGIFRAAYQYLGNSRIIRSKKNEGFAVPASPIPELVAANLARDRHWCTDFKSLVNDKESFKRINYSHGGLVKMKEAIKDDHDKNIIRAFHEAWRRTMGALGERARRDGLDPNRLFEVEREKIRNAILRARTADALASWFLRFCADATKGGALSGIRDNRVQLQQFIFNQRNFERFQNLCLFALVSYASEDSNTNKGGNQ